MDRLPPNAPLVDTHAHLDSSDYSSDLVGVLERSRAAGLVATVTVGFEPGDWDKTLAITHTYHDVHPALGVHPNSADQASDTALARLEALCRGEAPKRVVALGETGLDYYREYVSHQRQQEAFRAHLSLARDLDLPVIIHNRDAHTDVMDILRRDGQGTRGIMHSVSGDVSFALECIRLDYMVSLAGPVTFRKAVDKHAIATTVPLEWLLLETDCPYLTPEPFRGRRNEPSYVRYTAQAIANLREISYEEVAKVTTANALRLYNIDPNQGGRATNPSSDVPRQTSVVEGVSP